MMSAVRSNQKREMPVRTRPLSGMGVGRTTSKADIRSLATSSRRSPTSNRSRTLPLRTKPPETWSADPTARGSPGLTPLGRRIPLLSPELPRSRTSEVRSFACSSTPRAAPGGAASTFLSAGIGGLLSSRDELVQSGDGGGHVPQEVAFVEAGGEGLVGGSGGDVRVGGEQLTQLAALVGSPQRVALDDSVRLLPRHARFLDQG